MSFCLYSKPHQLIIMVVTFFWVPCCTKSYNCFFCWNLKAKWSYPSFTHIVQESKNALSIVRMFHFSMYTQTVIGLQGHCHYMHYARALASTNFILRQYANFQRSYQIFLIIMKKKKSPNRENCLNITYWENNLHLISTLFNFQGRRAIVVMST